jgi:hypothetical protein
MVVVMVAIVVIVVTVMRGRVMRVVATFAIPAMAATISMTAVAATTSVTSAAAVTATVTTPVTAATSGESHGAESNETHRGQGRQKFRSPVLFPDDHCRPRLFQKAVLYLGPGNVPGSIEPERKETRFVTRRRGILVAKT